MQMNPTSHPYLFDPLDPAALADPYPHYAYLRDHDAVHWGAAGGAGTPGCWYITRYDDVVAVLKDARFGREVERRQPEARIPHWEGCSGESDQSVRTSPPKWDAPQPEGVAASGAETAAAIIREWMVLRDPPYHTYLRSLVQRSFTPQMITRWMPRMKAIARQLLDDVAESGEFDLLHDVAKRFPVLIVAEMLGVPPADASRFTPWTEALAAVIEFEQTPEVRARGNAAMAELADYLGTIIAARRQEPADDLISALLALDDDLPLSDATLIGTCTQLLFGGNDPVAHLIGNGLRALLLHPHVLIELQQQAMVSEATIDELMRYDSSVQMTFRYALEDVTLHGRTLRRGDLVAVVMGAANRDERHFVAPDTLDLTRSPNRHLSLGVGIHYCMGAALARTEGRILLTELLQCLPHWQIDLDNLTWQRTVAVRGLAQLPIRTKDG